MHKQNIIYTFYIFIFTYIYVSIENVGSCGIVLLSHCSLRTIQCLQLLLGRRKRYFFHIVGRKHKVSNQVIGRFFHCLTLPILELFFRHILFHKMKFQHLLCT